MKANIYTLKVFKKRLITFVSAVAMAVTLFASVPLPAHAAEYTCGAYGRGAYDRGNCQTASTNPDAGGGSGGLDTTGQALTIALPALAILGGTVLLFRTRKKMRDRQNFTQ